MSCQKLLLLPLLLLLLACVPAMARHVHGTGIMLPGLRQFQYGSPFAVLSINSVSDATP